ncbi:MAG: amino acid racemase [Sphingobium sp.]|nr:amino acid racemase [Sphingobium sp.]
MRKLGLIGGLSWGSTARYYQLINEGIARRLGGFHSAPLVLESLDFAEIARCATEEGWEAVGDHMIAAARRLEQAGAEGLMICANSVHVVDSRIREAVNIPLLHIADAVGVKMKADGIKTAAIIGTSNVMAEKFYRQSLVSYGVSLLPPDMEMAERIDKIVYGELVLGKITRDAERFMKSELTDIAKQQVQAVVLACTELEMIVDVRANLLPIYDSLTLHSEAGVEFILGD